MLGKGMSHPLSDVNYTPRPGLNQPNQLILQRESGNQKQK
ncbi:hypothetical protein FQN60_016211 [Etheostoma spectabile]|uniref:Uncharacterized protein n=1 Tax=Etheostoma spectabile TaxID=54343 RepID=A0A5J5D1J5_9PERO|nr:hypothetical protein FQN60_016211 [Etheostoma spectabile]